MPLVALSQSHDARLPIGMFDVRSWDVKTLVDDRSVGVVHDLLLDEAGDPRYLDVDLGFFRKHVLLPIGQARVDRAAHAIWIPGFSRDQFERIPEYHHDLAGLGRGDEVVLVAAYTSAYSGERSHPRPLYAGTVYGPSELETPVHVMPRLAPLSRLDDFRIAEGEPDPRGWAVHSTDDRRIGAIDELMIDTRALKVRYLVCEVDEQELGLEMLGRRVLIPVGFARLDPERRAVLVERFPANSAARLPLYSGQEITHELEHDVLEPYAPGSDGAGFYDDARFDPRGFYGPGAA